MIHWGVVLIGFFTELIIEFYPELPSKLNYLWLVLLIGPPLWLLENMLGELFIGRKAGNAVRRLGEEKTRVINKILAAIINVPVTALLLLALLASLFK